MRVAEDGFDQDYLEVTVHLHDSAGYSRETPLARKVTRRIQWSKYYHMVEMLRQIPGLKQCDERPFVAGALGQDKNTLARRHVVVEFGAVQPQHRELVSAILVAAM